MRSEGCSSKLCKRSTPGTCDVARKRVLQKKKVLQRRLYKAQECAVWGLNTKRQRTVLMMPKTKRKQGNGKRVQGSYPENKGFYRDLREAPPIGRRERRVGTVKQFNSAGGEKRQWGEGEGGRIGEILLKGLSSISKGVGCSKKTAWKKDGRKGKGNKDGSRTRGPRSEMN